MPKKERSLRRSRNRRDPFRLLGAVSHDSGGDEPPEIDRNQGRRDDENKRESQSPNRSGAVVSQETSFGVLGEGTYEFVVLSDTPLLQSRPVDVSGGSGIFVYHVERAVESGCVSVLDMMNSGSADWRQLSEQEAETLPEMVSDELENQDLVQATAIVDDLAESLNILSVGWDSSYQNSADVLASLLRRSDGRGFTRAVYYYLSVFASETYSNPEALAELKDIQPSTIHSELRRADAEWRDQLIGVGRESVDGQ